MAASPDLNQRLFVSASISVAADGGWLALVNLGDGATLTRWFPDEEAARRYIDELSVLLTQPKQVTSPLS